MAYTTIFVVSGDSAILDSVSELFAATNLHVETFPHLQAWLQAVDPEQRGCLVLDAGIRDFANPERLSLFTSICTTRPVLLLVDRGDVPIAVRAIKNGAINVLEKPCRDEKLLESIERAAAAVRDADDG